MAAKIKQNERSYAIVLFQSQYSRRFANLIAQKVFMLKTIIGPMLRKEKQKQRAHFEKYRMSEIIDKYFSLNKYDLATGIEKSI